MNTSKQILSAFFDSLINKGKGKETLLLNLITPKLIDISNASVTEILNEDELEGKIHQQFDLVICNFPFLAKKFEIEEIPNVLKFRVNQTWVLIYKALGALSQEGQAFIIVDPSFLYSHFDDEFRKILDSNKFFCNGVFELPEKILHPETSFQPILIQIERHKRNKLFVGEISEDFEPLLNSLHSRSSTDSLLSGILIDRDSFVTINMLRAKREIDNLKSHYKEYKAYKLKDVALEVNLTSKQFEKKNNCIYLPRNLNIPVVLENHLSPSKNKHYFQVVLNSEIVKAEYLFQFYSSEYGKQILKSLEKGNLIKSIEKGDLINSIVTIPEMFEQIKLVETYQKLSSIQNTVEQELQNVIVNPDNIDSIRDNLQRANITELSVEEHIKKLISGGENLHVEFKQTFSKDIKTGQQNKELEKSALKTVAGFLNADGGVLLIGVSDDKKITGVENDIFVNKDKYLLHFKNAIHSKIGAEFYSLINFDLYEVSAYHILVVKCVKSNEPCFYEGVDFYVRTTASTDKLEGKKQHEYIRTRFYGDNNKK